ncbi:hypothetical protein PFUGPA_01528 [Plasmodium falciparum Palo Alto/Uganda]|uniref:Uncharacterized protein n=1 Tax=Plasmodium falciparum (isolate Palo Alto / Uganda) TaxID=57270 RepID=W4J358_PLAFP|nr:hypothetical protein PFUGPA_01528 [Plasmodium falciparum Palo Alto/Uganda]
MGNEICGCQTEVSKKYNIDLDQFRKRSHNTDHLCKLLGRTYDPYKNISKVKDIVQQHVLQDIQKKKG